MVEVTIARRATLGIELLQLRRTKEDPMRGQWQPVMGHIEAGETAQAAARRELREEVGLLPPYALYALNHVFPFFLAKTDEIVLLPRFLVEVPAPWSPLLNHEHDAHRWVPEHRIDDMFLWPGQRAALHEASALLRGDASADWLRLEHPNLNTQT
jgi:dihydroneopterin triphosphate diphosphatase